MKFLLLLALGIGMNAHATPTGNPFGQRNSGYTPHGQTTYMGECETYSCQRAREEQREQQQEQERRRQESQRGENHDNHLYYH